MADALCGPSNALQNFQKHTSKDRTLQQDRLLARESPLEGFRSGPGPNAGALDAEFDAFQAGVSAPPPQLHYPQPPPSSSYTPPPFVTQWANEFQRLLISSPSPLLAQAGLLQSRFGPGGASSWDQDFMQQQRETTSFAPRQSGLSSTSGASMQNGPAFPILRPGNLPAAFSPLATEHDRLASQTEHNFDNAAFERAFDAAHADVLDEQATTVKGLRRSDVLKRTSVSNHLAAEAALEDQESGEIAFPNYANASSRPAKDMVTDRLSQDPQREVQSNKVAPANETDELAQMAGQLLDSVADNTSQKFQSSAFLELMRRLRDHETWVDGDKLVENTAPSVSASESIPSDQQDTDYGRGGDYAADVPTNTDSDDYDPGDSRRAFA